MAGISDLEHDVSFPAECLPKAGTADETAAKTEENGAIRFEVGGDLEPPTTDAGEEAVGRSRIFSTIDLTSVGARSGVPSRNSCDIPSSSESSDRTK